MEIIRTIQWTSESPKIFTLCARMSKLGKATLAKPQNFVEFIASYENCSYQDLVNFAKKWIMSDRFKDANVTSYATLSEDRCLFRTHGTHHEALDIILRYLDILNSGGVSALWSYLDQEEKAVVHFINRNGFYAELYCQTGEECSVLHLLEHNGQTLFVPVVFVHELTDEIISQVQLCGNCHLQSYLPREQFDCLGKGGKRNSGLKNFKHLNDGNAMHSHDGWDSL